MSKSQDRNIYPINGKWANKRQGAEKPSGLHDTQRDAINAARRMLKNQGGGELIVHGIDCKIRQKDTVYPGNDSFPPQG